MTAREGELRFCVDESALGLGKALEAARHDTVHIGHKLLPECPHGTLDSDWIPRVAQRGLVLIGRDKHIRTRPAERQALYDAGLRVLRIGGKRDLSTWDWLTRLVRNWHRIEELLEQRSDGPWIYLVNDAGLVEVPLVTEPPARRPGAKRAAPRKQAESRLADLFTGRTD